MQIACSIGRLPTTVKPAIGILHFIALRAVKFCLLHPDQITDLLRIYFFEMYREHFGED